MVVSLQDPQPAETVPNSNLPETDLIRAEPLPTQPAATLPRAEDDVAEFEDEIPRRFEGAGSWPARHGGINE
jgi:hypothetical protein